VPIGTEGGGGSGRRSDDGRGGGGGHGLETRGGVHRSDGILTGGDGSVHRHTDDWGVC
jgi:hypothetical protein